MQYMGLCLLRSSISLIIVRICILFLIIIMKSELWPICHCLGLGHETMVCVVCIFIFLLDYGISSPLAIDRPQSYARPLKNVKVWQIIDCHRITNKSS